MGWMSLLKGKTIYLDTAPLIYYLEENPVFVAPMDIFFEALAQTDFEVVTSSLTITEVLVHPIRENNNILVEAYTDILLHSEHLRVVSLTPEVAEIAARLRAHHKIKTPDAIHVATAIATRADYILTNDFRLSSLPEPSILVVSELL